MRPAPGLAFAILSVLACGDLLQEPDTGSLPVPVRLEIVSGNGQTGEPGAALTEPLRVSLIDRDEQPIARLRVEWTAVGGSGEAEPRNSFTLRRSIVLVFAWLMPSALSG